MHKSPVSTRFAKQIMPILRIFCYNGSLITWTVVILTTSYIFKVWSQSQSYFTTGGLQPISSSWRQAPWDSRPVILFSNWALTVIVLMKHPLWQENGSVVYIFCWSSPAQSFSGPSPAGLMTIFYCLMFETPRTWRARSPHLYSPGTGWPSYTPRHWVPFLSPPTTRRDIGPRLLAQWPNPQVTPLLSGKKVERNRQL
jgi:hypothetical protein